VIKSIQGILVVSFALWACLPTYGGAAVLSASLLLFGSGYLKLKRARAQMEQVLPTLTLSEAGKGWARRYALYFIDGNEARSWALAHQLTGLLCLLTAIWFVGRGLLTWNLWLLAVSAALVLALQVFVRLAVRYDPTERLNADIRLEHQLLHREVDGLLSMKRVAGQWPPA
jgi:hypothetical protein